MSQKNNVRGNKKFDDHLIMVNFIYRPISRPISRKVNITPNIITSASLIFATVGCYLIYVDLFFLACIFIFLWQLFDHIDGDIAHIWNRKSKAGDYYDTVVCYYAVVALSTTASLYSNSVIGYFIGLTYLFSRLCYHKYNSYDRVIHLSAQTHFKPFLIRAVAQVRRELLSPSGFLPFLIILELLLSESVTIIGTFLILDHCLSVIFFIWKARQLDE
jgi:phosphatidylglycerophosphate synthase